MTDQRDGTLVIVFGAGGRLGQALLPMLAAGQWVVLAVMREKKPPNQPPNVHWIQIDVTEIDQWERSFHVLCGMADIHERVIIVDLLLDKATVTTMRSTLAAGTSYITRLRDRLAADNTPSSLVLASTTAVIAPWPYQTPYGIAKRRQLARYATARVVGRALLLPRLTHAKIDPHAVTYQEAAIRVEQSIVSVTTTEPTDLRLVPIVDIPISPNPCPSLLHRLTEFFARHLAICTTGKDSPAAHRLASHARLAVTPRWLRHHVDHHLVPDRLVRRLARRLETDVEEQQP